MRTLKLVLFVFIGFSLLALSACKKENINVDLLGNQWQAVKLKKEGATFYKKAKGEYLLTFGAGNNYGFSLDVNDSGGDYEISSPGTIAMDFNFFTLVCCDSDFANEAVELLPKMTSYVEKGDKLTFWGNEGEIVFKRVE